MSDPYVGEIRLFGGNFAPLGWHFCDGSLVPISQNEALFALIGTTYGGDGSTSFALPDLRGRVPVHISNNIHLGAKGGVESVTLIEAQIPAHTHAVNASTENGVTGAPTDHVWASSSAINPYQAAAPSVRMNPAAVHSTGAGHPHDNVMPSIVLNYIISMEGIWPSPE